MNLPGWARACSRPLVLFFDEIDALRGQSLISVLRQLRTGFADRPGAFPLSVALCEEMAVPVSEPVTAERPSV
ncbi:hypothetical protein [Archangium sp.]|uniref:hypothetical protein n=1 Tax=Archangium sp. TaxID=1872627 RepID=UPI002D6FA39F|nr:hypothetical protein [Archangium sp.]HYO59797.1 hypothetical protein [Archangium sp.]